MNATLEPGTRQSAQAEQSSAAREESRQLEVCDLCIVGAGIAGMNALFVASEYLDPNARVILIDRNATPGGMWNDTYDYVRLHQPHPMFTAGNIEWSLAEPPEHLASKREVLQHFAKCESQISEKIDLVRLYDCEFESSREVQVGDHHAVEIKARPLKSAEQGLLIKAQRCIKAFGFAVPENPPLTFSSHAVRSISPHGSTLMGAAMDADESPIYVVGGGKTGMDTAHALVSRYPQRKIHLVVGKGTVFASRDKAFPTGLGRYWTGTPGLNVFLRLCLLFDGRNGAEVFEVFKREIGVHLSGMGQQYMFGILSEKENNYIEQGVASVVSDYVEDVVDTESGPSIRYRSGEHASVEANAWFVNCTGYILREPIPYEPFLSEHGTTVSVQGSSSIHFLSSFASYFLVHLFYLDQLDKLPIYELNFSDLLQHDKKLWPFAAMTQVLYNILLITKVVPTAVMANCGLDFDRWFPMYRRIPGLMKFNFNRDRYLAHFRASLDTIAADFGVRCGPLVRQESQL